MATELTSLRSEVSRLVCENHKLLVASAAGKERPAAIVDANSMSAGLDLSKYE